MCHLFQNAVGDVAKYGLLKFAGILNPRINAAPIAMSVYPEKSPYTCTAKANAPRIIVNDSAPIGLKIYHQLKEQYYLQKTFF